MAGTKTITPGLAEVVRILGKVKKPGLTLDEIIAKAAPEYKDTVGKVIANARIRDAVLMSPPSGTRTEPAFVLAPKTLERYPDLDKLIVVERSRRPKKKGRAKSVPRETPPKPPAKPKEDTLPILNISLEANNLAEYASQVVTQNSQYREVLANVYNTIGKLLYPNQTPHAVPGSESKPSTQKEE